MGVSEKYGYFFFFFWGGGGLLKGVLFYIWGFKGRTLILGKTHIYKWFFSVANVVRSFGLRLGV